MTFQLRFLTLADLWHFKVIAKVKTVEVLASEHLLIGEFEEAEIELAQRGYKAELIGAHTFQNNRITSTNLSSR
jgi:hypothetical protein